MKKKDAAVATLTPEQIRAELITKKVISPNRVPTEVATCKSCKEPFERLVGRSWEVVCGARH